MTLCRMIPELLLLLLLLVHGPRGSLGAEVRSSIVGGQEAVKGSWPWMVHLNFTSNGIDGWRCGGTILNKQWVLTAGNCLARNPKPRERRSMAWIGAHSLQKEGARFMQVENYKVKDGYEAQSVGFKNDIAVVKLKKTIDLKKGWTVGLPTGKETFDSSSECWILGWGNVGTNDPLPDPENLQQLKINIVPQSVCKATYPQLTDDMLCAGGDPAGKKDACEGDYGGPLVCRSGSGFVQVGIMSYGSPDGCGLPGRPGVYTRVSKYLRFIKDYTGRGAETSDED
ncbi:uncharacterized protein V6R79_003503 [Siganus canaliculatus]